jgi:putative tricarboxylic transport membrane protein
MPARHRSSGDTFSDIMLILLAAPFAAIALQFGPVEFTAIILFSFTMIAARAGKSLVKGIMAAASGCSSAPGVWIRSTAPSA